MKEEMGDTPVAVISRELERVKVSLVLVLVLSVTFYVLNNMYHPWLSYFWL